jgi:hypothetical protein
MADDATKLDLKLPSVYAGSTTATTISSGWITLTHAGPEFTGTPVSELETLEYEAGMLFRALEILRNERHRLDELVLRNALTEAAVLHARSLCEAFLEYKPKDDDIRLSRQFYDWDTDSSGKFSAIKAAVDRLRSAYSPYRVAFNKMVMHSTKLRRASGIYDHAFADLEPILREIVGHIESLMGYKFKPVE